LIPKLGNLQPSPKEGIDPQLFISRVGGLLFPNLSTWDDRKITDLFDQISAEETLNIRLLQNSSDDKIFWPGSRQRREIYSKIGL